MSIATILSALIWAVVLSGVGWGVWQLKRRTGVLPTNFLVAVGVLAVAAVGLNGATQFMQLHFKKLPVAIGIPLKEIPSRLGPWVQVSKDEPLESDVEQALATKEYIFRDYVDERVVGAETIAKFADKSANERKSMLMHIMQSNQFAVVNLAVTYYTGMVDTVAHIPDRCYIADGYVPSEYTTETWQTGKESTTEARFINFEDQTGNNQKLPRNVAYFFRVNDRYTSDPLGVRARLQDLREKYGFYSKVELMMTTRDRARAATSMTDFLTFAMPEIEKCYPDWKKVTLQGVK